MLVIAISLTGLAALAFLTSTPAGAVRPISLLTPLAEQLVASSVLSAQAAAVLYAPAVQRGLIVPRRTLPAGGTR